MGLFSFLNKNKQETTAEDSGYFSRDDDAAVATRARSKRASSAGESAAPRRSKEARAAADDPVLPEKKRARRRLVGAIALALAVAVGLPMVLDSEPKQIASDIAIQIPARDKAAPLPLPAAPGTAPTPADSLDTREQFVEPKPDPADIKTVTLDSNARAGAPKAEPKLLAKAEQKPIEVKPAKVEVKPAKAEEKPAKAEEKAVAKPAAAQEDTRAMAILEGKASDKAPKTDAAAPKFVVQVAALATQEKVTELQDKLKEAGIKSFTHKVPTATGERIQVRVGPFSREEADKMRARLDKVGLSGSQVRPDGK